MRNDCCKKALVVGIVVLFVVAVSPISGSNIMRLERGDCPINITVHEAWEFLNDTSNGIQIPIDIRSEEEWNESRIDTPWPEHPRWFGNGTLQEFMEMYDGGDVIIYCKGGFRSLIFCIILCDAGFNGTVYNMIGGITAWMEEGYPIRNNTPPDTPTIDGPIKGNPGVEYNYTFVTTDPDGDDVQYCVYLGDGVFLETLFHASGTPATVHLIWYEYGTFTINAWAVDIHGAKSNWTELVVTMPRNRATTSSLFLQFLERFPLLERLLNLI